MYTEKIRKNSFSLYLILKNKLRRKEQDNLDYFSLKIRPELKIANFLNTILRIFCDLIFNNF